MKNLIEPTKHRHEGRRENAKDALVVKFMALDAAICVLASSRAAYGRSGINCGGSDMHSN